MHMPEDDPHSSTLPGFRVTRDPERAITRSRPGRKKKLVEFEDIQQPIPNSPEENYPLRFITQLPYGVTHIYYTGKEHTYWFYEYCGIGHPIVREDVKFSAYSYLRAWERENRKKTNDQLDDVRRASLLSRMSITWGIDVGESARDTQRIQEFTDEVATLRRHLDSVNDQLYAHVRPTSEEGHDVRMVPLPPGGGARMRQRESSLFTRGGGTSRRRRGTRDDFDPS
ncbi:hypothetical protein GIB67_039613 [Kingdonia uniflora]|uniref:Uncharacterized protein n=1 Tax=Kingdonia uniflora TaxID=39325 RepID=A0A7J7MDD7_9MAGN|nr:hypothetical protein GIB67_039613 [Kingdonia uniflora]